MHIILGCTFVYFCTIITLKTLLSCKSALTIKKKKIWFLSGLDCFFILYYLKFYNIIFLSKYTYLKCKYTLTLL